MTQEPEHLRFRREIDALGFAMIYHVLTLDQDLSDGAFRVYALLLKYARQAGGCWPGVERMATDLGISEPTVKRRLAELVDRGLVTRERRYGRSSVTWLEDLEPLYHDQLKNDLFEQPFDQLKNDTIDQLKSDTTEEQAEKKKQGATAAFSEEEQQALDLLLTVPKMDAATARRLIKTCDLAEVPGWVAEGKQADLGIAAALVVARLKAGEPAPATGDDKGADYWRRQAKERRRFIEGKYADYIEH